LHPHPGPLPKEREPLRPILEISETVTLFATVKPFSLSQRERVGVRGKEMLTAWIGLKAGLQTANMLGARTVEDAMKNKFR
jgi:hypothetical protein